MNAMNARTYANAGEELTARIVTLAETHPEIVDMESPWDLFKIGLECSDLQPSLAQASCALAHAKYILKAGAHARRA